MRHHFIREEKAVEGPARVDRPDVRRCIDEEIVKSQSHLLYRDARAVREASTREFPILVSRGNVDACDTEWSAAFTNATKQ